MLSPHIHFAKYVLKLTLNNIYKGGQFCVKNDGRGGTPPIKNLSKFMSKNGVKKPEKTGKNLPCFPHIFKMQNMS